MIRPSELAVLALLLATNVAHNTVVPEPAQLVTGPAVAALAVVVAVRAGFRAADLGLARADIRAGLRVGAWAVAVVVAGLALALVVPATRELLADDGLAATSVGSLLYESLVRIPIATAGPEEVLFRGVVLGMTIRRLGTLGGVVASSVLFGLWHVLPTSGDAALMSDAGSVSPSAGTLAVVLGTVAVTALAGAVLAWLRLRSGSVVAPFLAHWAINGLGLLAAAVA